MHLTNGLEMIVTRQQWNNLWKGDWHPNKIKMNEWKAGYFETNRLAPTKKHDQCDDFVQNE